MVNVMNKSIEDRVRFLERAVEKQRKNEFLGFGKPKRSDEAGFTTKLFSKYPTLGKSLHASDKANKDSGKMPFHLVLSTNDDGGYKNVYFIIGGPDRSNMYCTAYGEGDIKIGTLKPFNLDKDVNTVAKFMLEILQKNVKRSYEDKSRKLEEASLSSFDCESLRKSVEDKLTNDVNDDIMVESDSANADNGIVIISIYDPDWITEYSVTMNEVDDFKVDCEDKQIGLSDSLDEVVELIVDHFTENFVD